MGRVISQEKKDSMRAIREARPEALGPALGELVINNGVPVEAVARALRVTEPTIYRWMYGTSEPVDIDKRVKIKRFLAILRKAKRDKALPMTGTTKERSAIIRALIVAPPPTK